MEEQYNKSQPGKMSTAQVVKWNWWAVKELHTRRREIPTITWVAFRDDVPSSLSTLFSSANLPPTIYSFVVCTDLAELNSLGRSQYLEFYAGRQLIVMHIVSGCSPHRFISCESSFRHSWIQFPSFRSPLPISISFLAWKSVHLSYYQQSFSLISSSTSSKT